MRDLRKAQYQKFIEMCNLHGKRIIETGAGRGEFLGFFEGFDVDVYGIENNAKLVEVANERGLKVTEGFAEDGDTVIKGAPFDAFTSFNFLEHQPNPNGMLQAIYNNLTDDGVGLLTVPSLEYILQYDGFYELIRDHIAYYTFDTLEFLLNKNGFVVIDKEMVNRDTLAVIVKKRTKVDMSRVVKSYDSIQNEIYQYIEQFQVRNEKVAIWGASHQGFTIASTLNLKDRIAYIIDSADFKQGKYAPASHIPIVSPEHFFKEPVKAIIIIAPGYTNEIAEIIKKRYGSDVQIATLKSEHLEILH